MTPRPAVACPMRLGHARLHTPSMIAPPHAAPGKPDWARDGAAWPNRGASRFVRAGGIVWHVQTGGHGPVLLLLHGTGAATHSWRGLAPLLAPHFTLVAPDLPGHGFTQTPSGDGLTLPGMARLVGALVAELGLLPAIMVGHSAGAAVGAEMILAGHAHPRALVALNGAFLPFPGPAATLFPGIARALFVNPLVPRLFTLAALSDGGIARFLARATGSSIAPRYAADYARLFRFHGHVAGALGMMASWDLAPLERALPRLGVRLALVVGEGDTAVPPSAARRVQRAVPGSIVYPLPGLGHLAHEEAPDAVAEIIAEVAREVP